MSEVKRYLYTAGKLLLLDESGDYAVIGEYPQPLGQVVLLAKDHYRIVAEKDATIAKHDAEIERWRLGLMRVNEESGEVWGDYKGYRGSKRPERRADSYWEGYSDGMDRAALVIKEAHDE